MNAHDKGRQHGFAERLKFIAISKEAFQRIGQYACLVEYDQAQKQQEYLAGWMENWQEPHPKDCACDVCQDILTY